MRGLNVFFQNRRIDFGKLISYGFSCNENEYIYKRILGDGAFQMFVEFLPNQITSWIVDLDTNEEYLSVDIASFGEFVGTLRDEYEAVLEDIRNTCSSFDSFSSSYAKQIISYVQNTYQDSLEYLWKDSKNAVFRHHDSKKWYGVLLHVEKRKLGVDEDGIVEVINLKNTKEEIQRLVDNHIYFGGYHMNKQSWFSIILDGSVPIDEICHYIDISFQNT